MRRRTSRRRRLLEQPRAAGRPSASLSGRSPSPARRPATMSATEDGWVWQPAPSVPATRSTSSSLSGRAGIQTAPATRRFFEILHPGAAPGSLGAQFSPHPQPPFPWAFMQPSAPSLAAAPIGAMWSRMVRSSARPSMALPQNMATIAAPRRNISSSELSRKAHQALHGNGGAHDDRHPQENELGGVREVHLWPGTCRA